MFPNKPKKPFSRLWNFIKHYPGIISSLTLIILIPAALYFNLRLAADSFRERIDLITQKEAFIIERVFDSFIADFPDIDLAKNRIEQIINSNSDISYFNLEVENDGRFESKSKIEKTGLSPSQSTAKSFERVRLLAWEGNEAVGFLANDSQNNRQWYVAKPFYSSTGEKSGLIWLAISLKDTDLLFRQAERNSYTILAIAVILVLALIINHARLYENAISFTKLKEVDKVKDEFISMAAHELKTPVAVIKGYAQLIKDDHSQKMPSSAKDEDNRLNKIIATSDNLADLISDILDVSRIEQNRMPFNIQKISAYDTVKKTVDDLQPKAEEKGIGFSFDPGEQPCEIMADPGRLNQVLINLISNAIKYTLKGEINISIAKEEFKKRCILTVRDTGVGMTAEEQKNLFSKFYRAKNDKTAEIPGTGLGLWISKSIVEKMNGEILVESMENAGTKFKVIFPLA